MRIFQAIVLALLVAVVSALPANTTSLLHNYAVPNRIIDNLTQVPITYGNLTYEGLYTGNTLYFLVNESADTFVTNSSQIYNIIYKYEINRNANVSLYYLGSAMRNYISTSANRVYMCVQSLGLDVNTCSLTNSCYSCLTAPQCSSLLRQTGGPTGPFGLSIMVFENKYNALNSNLSTFYANTNNTYGTAEERGTAIQNSFYNISNITSNLYETGVFPPPAGANYALCGSAGGSGSTGGFSSTGPWYCNAIPFCLPPTYNSSMLSNMTSMINNLKNVLPTTTYVHNLAENASSTTNVYILPMLQKEKNAQLSNILNTTLANYGTIVNKTSILLAQINDAELSNNLASLEHNYTILLTNYQNINLTKYNATLFYQMNKLDSSYAKASSIYENVSSFAKNNTVLLLSAQSGSVGNQKLISLAFEQYVINGELNSKIDNLTQIYTALESVNKQASGYKSPEGLEALARSIDGPFGSSLALAAGLPYSTAVGLMPIFALILSLIIGAILFAIFYVFFRKRETSGRALPIGYLYIGIVVLILYLAITYVYANVANSSAPLSTFENAVHNSKSIAIVLNGTTSNMTATCANKIHSSALAEGKSVSIVYISQDACKTGTTLSSKDSCLNNFVDKNTPIIVLTSSPVSQMKLYSMYGTVLYVSGTDSFMSSCYPEMFIS